MNKYIAPEDISWKLGNKRHLYEVLTIDCKCSLNNLNLAGLYLPPYEKWTVDFLKQILSKSKLVSPIYIEKSIFVL